MGLLFITPDMEGRKIGFRTSSLERLKSSRNSRQKGPAEKEGTGEVYLSAESDSARFALISPLVTMHGYDKRGSANRESFIIANDSELTLTELTIELTYLSETGAEELHSREIILPCRIAGGRRLKFDVPSWDPQHSYRYYKSTPPRKSRATLPTTPYRISAQVTGLRYLDGK